MKRLLPGLGIAVAAVSVSLLVVAVITAGTEVTPAGLLWALPNIVAGGLLTALRPRQPIGWLFSATGLLVSSSAVTDRLTDIGLRMSPVPWWGTWSAWYGEIYWPSMIYTMLIFLPLLFPTGRPPSPRWRPITRFMIGFLAVATIVAALQEQLHSSDGLVTTPNPIGIRGLPDIEEAFLMPIFSGLTFVFLVIAFSSLIVRYRRSQGIERQQMKWFTSAGLVLITGFIAQGVMDGVFGTRIELLDLLLFLLPPLAASVAVLKYRLYAIDRLISRTVTYALVTAVLAGVYLGAVTVLTAWTAPRAGNSPIAVAAATLAAAAVFRPALRRIQGVVDRRFNRAHYDAARTVDSFRTQMRDDVDLDRLSADLVATAERALQPRSTMVWVRSPEAQL